jgi:hypothetical protein
VGLKLIGEIALDGAGFERGLHQASHHVSDFVKNATVAAFGFYGVEESIKKTVETATELVNTSRRLDVSVEQLQLLKAAAKEGGTEIGALSSAFEKLDIARAKALNGDKEALAAFAKLGVTGAQLKDQTAAMIFTTSLSSTAKNNSVEDIGPALKEVLGKGFGELIPTLKTDFDELGAKLKKLGSIMDSETAVSLKMMGDEFEIIGTILTTHLAPALLWTAETLYKAFAKFSGLSAAAGAGTSNWGTKEWFQAAMTPIVPAFAALVAKNFDSKSAKTAYDDTTKPLIDSLDELKKKIAEDAEALKHPKPRTGEAESPEIKAAKRIASIPSDALVKTGNFLGTNGNTIERANQQKIELLRQIAHNTAGASFGTNAHPANTFKFLGIGIPLR